MSKHTPGPWIGAGPSFGDPLPRYTTEIITEHEYEHLDGPVSICEFSFAHRDEQNEANARLIAAAPTILQKLIIAREYIAACIQSHAETATNQTTGLVDDPDNVLALEADQDLLNGIEAAIAQATEAA